MMPTAKTSPRIRAHRILKHIARFRTTSLPVGLPPTSIDEEVFGYYENDPGLTPDVVVVTSKGIHFKAPLWQFVGYKDIDAVSVPEKTSDTRRIALKLKGKGIIELLISGAPGRSTRDVYEFGRYLQRVVDDMARVNHR